MVLYCNKFWEMKRAQLAAPYPDLTNHTNRQTFLVPQVAKSQTVLPIHEAIGIFESSMLAYI